MTITSSPEQAGVTPEAGQPASIAEALQIASAYQGLAAFLRIHPGLAERAVSDVAGQRFLVPVTWTKDPLHEIVSAIRLANEAGVPVTEYVNGKSGGVLLHFGRVVLQVYADAEQVCRSVVVGTVLDVRHALVVDLNGNPREFAAQDGAA